MEESSVPSSASIRVNMSEWVGKTEPKDPADGSEVHRHSRDTVRRGEGDLDVKPSVLILPHHMHHPTGDPVKIELNPVIGVNHHSVPYHNSSNVIILQGPGIPSNLVVPPSISVTPSSSGAALLGTPPKRTPQEEAERDRRRARQRELNRNRMRQKRAALTAEEREEERRVNRERMRKLRAEMPNDEHEKLKMKRREEARLRRAMESPEQRQARLQARSGQKRRKRPGNSRNRASSASTSSGNESSASLNQSPVQANGSSPPTNAPGHLTLLSSQQPTLLSPSVVVSAVTSQGNCHELAGLTASLASAPTSAVGPSAWSAVHHTPGAHLGLPMFPGCGLTEVRGSWIDYSTLPMTRP